MVELTASILSGKIRGRVVDDCATFLGIPFAAPPVGTLRFKPCNRYRSGAACETVWSMGQPRHNPIAPTR